LEAGKVFDMNCQEFWNSMPELDRGPDHLGHLRECASCSALWENHGVLANGLRSAASRWSHVSAPAGVEARLMAEFRRSAHPIPALPPTRPSFRAPAAWFAAAAAVMALAFVLVSQRQPVRLASVGEMALVQSTFLPVVDDSIEPGDGFVPLPNTTAISPDEEVNLVRVEVPRSSMIEVGYAVNAEQASELVQAEVMIGSDGVARAVRFLDE
jgi:hypothetical protein